MLVLGLTGGIASGKSMVAGMLQRLGAEVVSADDLAREVVRPGSSILACIAERFGSEVLQSDGGLNRPLLAEKIFSDPQARKALDRITHPAIAELASQRFEDFARKGARIVVYDAPLLYEAGADTQVDGVIVVAVDAATQLQRLMLRDGLDRQAAKARVEAQMPLMQKIARADYVIDNNGSLEATRQQVVDLMARLASEEAGSGHAKPETAE